MLPTKTEGNVLPQGVQTGSDAYLTPLQAAQPPSIEKPRPGFDAKAEAHFLADEFGITPLNAAEVLLDDPTQAQVLAAQVMAEERQRDPLSGVPVPGPQKDPEHLEKEVADLEKPVVHEPSAPT